MLYGFFKVGSVNWCLIYAGLASCTLNIRGDIQKQLPARNYDTSNMDNKALSSGSKLTHHATKQERYCCRKLRWQQCLRPDYWVQHFGQYSWWLVVALKDYRCMVGLALPRGEGVDCTQIFTLCARVFVQALYFAELSSKFKGRGGGGITPKLSDNPANLVRLGYRSRCKREVLFNRFLISKM